VNRGEVWWAEHPEAGRRPHLVLTRQEAIAVLQSVLAVPATRTIRGIPTEVALDRADGMPERCVLSLENLTVLPKAYLVERICSLSGERMIEVCQALAVATACSA
jgi:mRNA interferase MazF